MKKLLLSSLMVTNGLLCMYAQEMSAVLIEKGDILYSKLQFSDALVFYKQAYAKITKPASGSRSKKDELASKVAECYWLQRNFDSAQVWYQKVGEQFRDPKGVIHFRKAELSAISGDYAKAAELLKDIKGYSARAEGFLTTGKMKRDSADWTLGFLEEINTGFYREFSPLLIGSSMLWATNQPAGMGKQNLMSWDNMGYSRMIQVGQVNTLMNVQPPTDRKLFGPQDLEVRQPDYLARHFAGADVDLIKSDPTPKLPRSKLLLIDSLTSPVKGTEKYAYNLAHGTYNATTGRVYFSVNRQEKLKNELRTIGIVEADLKENAFVNGSFILPADEEHSNMHPAIHPDGKILVFSSNKQGGKGGFDLYYATRNENGTWGDVRPVVGVNTIGNELFPTFSPDGRLYFSSDAMAGLGGLDLYLADYKNTTVSNTMHLPYPVNSAYDDFGMTFRDGSKAGYFTSDRLGSDDIYSFSFMEKKVGIGGKVISEETGKVKPGVKVIVALVEDNGTHLPIDSSLTDQAGSYQFAGRPNREYHITAIDPMDVQSEKANTHGQFGMVKVKDIILKDKKPVEPVVIPQVPDTFRYIVYFDFDKYDIKKDAKSTLDEAIEKLNEDPDYKCILYGHTDMDGSDGYNDNLSQNRSAAVKQFMVNAGIEAAKISFDFFGEKKLVIVNANKRSARFNRRVEITITK